MTRDEARAFVRAAADEVANWHTLNDADAQAVRKNAEEAIAALEGAGEGERIAQRLEQMAARPPISESNEENSTREATYRYAADIARGKS